MSDLFSSITDFFAGPGFVSLLFGIKVIFITVSIIFVILLIVLLIKSSLIGDRMMYYKQFSKKTEGESAKEE